MGKRVLGVTAHPDDLEWYAGATVAKLAREGAEIFMVVCTDGDKGSYDPQANPEDLARQRRTEQQEAARVLGVREVQFLGYPDGELEPSPGLRQALARIYRTIKPELVLAFDPWKEYELHPDHIAAGRAALDARIAAKMPLYCPELGREGIAAWAVPELWLFNANSPNFYVDVSELLEIQVRGLACHRSQPSVWDEGARRFILENAKENGTHIGAAYAQAFRRILIDRALVLAEGTKA